jgi:hypothetical protein
VSEVLLDRHGPVATVTPHQPGAMSAINGMVREQHPACLLETDRDPTIRISVGQRIGRLELDLLTLLPGTKDRQEAVSAGREKRQPMFQDS